MSRSFFGQFIHRAVAAYRSWTYAFGQSTTPKIEIIVTGTGFAIVTPKQTGTVSLDEVSAIVAYKINELTTDLLCCDLVTGLSDGKLVLTIHEEITGFDAVMAQFENLPGFNRRWREAVIHPPFAENPTIIYERAAAVA